MTSHSDRDRERLRYIQSSISRVEQYTQGGRQAFFRDPMVQDAVLRRLETLADATGNLSDDVRARYPQIPWREVRGFRNVAAHAYEGIDLSRIWEIVSDYLPALERVVAEELGSGREP